MDLFKAFDCLVHWVLIQKLSKYIFHYYATNILQSYLRGRTQFVSIGRNFSEEGNLEIGVPQISILWPLLFLIYTNNFYSFKDSTNCVFFEDDKTVSVKGSCLADLRIRNCSTQFKAKEWFYSNGLTRNESETVLMLFNLRNKGTSSWRQVLNF